VEILGHEAGPEGVKPNEGHLRAVREFPEPVDGASLLRLIGTCRYFEPFLPDLARRIQPLNKVLVVTNWNKKKRKAVSVVIPEWGSKWKQPQTAAFKDLKAELSNPVLLASVEPGRKKVLVTDASDVGVGSALLQKTEDEQLRPISFAFRKFTDAETRYTVSERECFGVVFALKKFREYVLEEPLKIIPQTTRR